MQIETAQTTMTSLKIKVKSSVRYLKCVQKSFYDTATNYYKCKISKQEVRLIDYKDVSIAARKVC